MKQRIIELFDTIKTKLWEKSYSTLIERYEDFQINDKSVGFEFEDAY